MDINGRPDHIEDYLITVRVGQWFGWKDSKNKTYANLIVHDGGSKPSESDCTNGLKALQDSWDANNKTYKLNRKAEYPSIEELVVALYDTEDKLAIENKRVEIKTKYPKESE